MFAYRPLRSITSAIALALMPACAGKDAGADWAGTIETLPGGAVRVTNPRAGVWDGGTPWSLRQELVLGEEDGEGPAVFASISAIEADDAGNIYVLDRQANDLRIFAPGGDHIRTVGRAGEGPGEYSAANGLAWLAEDTLVVIDQRGNRYSVLDHDGDYVRSVPRRLGFFGWAFIGGVAGDMIYEVSNVGPASGIRGYVLLGTRLRGIDVADPEIAMESGGASDAPRFAADTVDLAKPDGPDREPFTIRTSQGGMVMSVPFAGGPKFRLDGGELWFGHGGKPSIYHATLVGDTLAEILIDTEPVPVTSAEIDAWQGTPGIERYKAMGGKLDLDRIPDVKPYFDDIVRDADGNTWLPAPAAPHVVAFTVLDPDGRYLGQLRIDGVARESYVSPVVRNGRLYFVGRDELDVQRVYVYGIDRSGAAEANR